MPTTHNILLPVDLHDVSSLAAETAFATARAQGGKVDLLYVFVGSSGDAWKARAELSDAGAEVEVRLREHFAVQIQEGVIGQILVRFGDASRVIVDTADELGSSMIVVGTHGRHGMSRFWLGSVAEGVVRDAYTPVLVAKAPRPAAE